jgi:hypothetical protein
MGRGELFDLLDPLTDRLEGYSHSWRRGCKPLLVIVFSDEYPAIPPNSFDALYDVLAKFTRRTERKNQILVSFIQVGPQNDLYGAFAPKVKSSGARYKFTAVMDFDEVSRYGLVNAIQHLLTDSPLEKCPTLPQQVEQVEQNSDHHRKSSANEGSIQFLYRQHQENCRRDLHCCKSFQTNCARLARNCRLLDPLAESWVCML